MKRILIMFLIVFFTSFLYAFTDSEARPTNLEERFIEAASRGDLFKVKRLLRKGININARVYSRTKILPPPKRVGGQTALHKAAANGHIRVVRYLIEAGANPSIKDYSGRSAIHLAAHSGQYKVYRYLKKQSKNPGGSYYGFHHDVFVLIPSYCHQNAHYVSLGFQNKHYRTSIFGLRYGPSVAFDFSNENDPIYGGRLSYDLSYGLLMFKINVGYYRNSDEEMYLVTPEIGLTFELLSIGYGYNFPVESEMLPNNDAHRIFVQINMPFGRV